MELDLFFKKQKMSLVLSALGDFAATASAQVLLIQDVAMSLLLSWQTSGYNAGSREGDIEGALF